MVTVPRPRGQRGRPPKQESIFDLINKTLASTQEDRSGKVRDDLKACADDPVRFVETYLKWPEGQSLTPYQRDILAALPEKRRIAVRSPHGVGKTACAALAVIWFALTSEALEIDWKVVTTAGAWRQLTKYLWPEIHKWCRRLRWERLGRKPFSVQTELLSLSLKLDYGEAFAVATDNPDLIEGAHATRIFVLADEAKAIPPTIFDAVEGALSGGGAEVACAMAVSTPNTTSGRFREFWTKRTQYADWWVRHVTAQEAIAAGRLDPQVMADRKRQWGEDHPLYRIRMLGEFADESAEGVIPLSWVEAAQRRYEAWEQAGKPRNPTDPVTLGVDVARYGDDLSAIALKCGPIVERILSFAKQDTMETTGHVAALQIANPGALAVVDEIGVGASVLDRLREQGYSVEAFNASSRAPGPDKTGELQFLNCLTGATRVLPVGRLRRVYRAWYEGPLLRVNTASGNQFTATAKHRVLTRQGWVSVQELSVGDQVVDSGLVQRMSFGQPEEDRMPTSLRQLYRAARQVGCTERVMGSAVDFYGDRMSGDVDVVSLDGKLRDDSRTPPGRQQRKDGSLVGLLHRQRVLSRLRGQNKTLWSLQGAGRCMQHLRPEWSVVESSFRPRFRSGLLGEKPIGGGRVAQRHAMLAESVLDGELVDSELSAQRLNRFTGGVGRYKSQFVQYQRGQQRSGLFFAPSLDAMLREDTPDDTVIDAVCVGQLVHRLSSDIALDYIVSIDIVPHDHSDGSFVYTLETATGMYSTGSILHRNCRAWAWWTVRELLDPAQEPPPTLALPPDETLLEDLCAACWKPTSAGRIALEDKDSIKKRLGRSPDVGEAVIMAIAGELGESFVQFF